MGPSLSTPVWFAPLIINDEKLPVGSQKYRGILHVSQAITSPNRWKNSGTSAVIMMQTTQDWEGDDFATWVIC